MFVRLLLFCNIARQGDAPLVSTRGHLADHFALSVTNSTPGTMGIVRRPDRVVALQLYQRGISVSVIENAFVLAATRRLMRPANAPPLGSIRSLAYFLTVIEEVLGLSANTDYFQYLRHKLERITPTR